MDRQCSQWRKTSTPMSSNKIRLHLIKLSKPRIGWTRIFIMPHRTYGRFITHQTLIPWIITCRAERVVVEKEVNKHAQNTKSSSLMEAIARGMEDINKDHLMKSQQKASAFCKSENQNLYETFGILDPSQKRKEKREGF
ncbi:hypothetical protein ACTXT7_015160 [Hymenolepis weldensis]